MAFLIPTVERIAKLRKSAGGGGGGEREIYCLIISPTRELAAQIAAEAEALTKFHAGFAIVTIVGGTNINSDKRNFAGRTDILVATPGRLNDHLENTDGFARRFSNMSVLIMDEADQLLEMGFRCVFDFLLFFYLSI